MENKLKIKSEIKSEIKRLKEKGYPIDTFEGSAGYYDALDEVLNFIDSLPEEPISEELEEAAKNHAVERFRTTRDRELAEKCKWSFKAGALWQKARIIIKVYKWFNDNACNYFGHIPIYPFIDDLKQAMKDE